MKYLTITICFLIVNLLNAQVENSVHSFLEFNLSIDALDDYASAYYKDYLLIIGGSIQSKNAELSIKEPNTDLLIFDWRSDTVISMPLEYLNANLADQLAASGMAYYQDGDSLFLVGGFGYDSTRGLEMTFPAMIIMDVPKVVNCILKGIDPSPFMIQIYDDRLAIQQAALDKVNTQFFLAEGELAYFVKSKYENKYYIEKYDNEIRTFQLKIESGAIEILDFCIWSDIEAFYDAFETLIPSTIFDNNDYRFKRYPDY